MCVGLCLRDPSTIFLTYLDILEMVWVLCGWILWGES